MNSRSHGKDQESWPVDHLMQHGIQASGNMQFDVAEKFFRRVLQQDPTHLGAIDALAEVKIQCGEIDEAVELLLHSTSADPYSNPFKWFSLAQLRQGNDSVSTYKSGITVLTELLTKESTQEGEFSIRKQIAKAYCSIAELYLTDLCFDPNAEMECELAVNLAIDIYPDSLDALQSKASLLLSQNKGSEAAICMANVYKQLIKIRRDSQNRTLIAEMNALDSDADNFDFPEFDFCIASAKLLIECAAFDQALRSDAIDLLNNLMDDVDDHVEVWYLLGVVYLTGETQDIEAALYYLEQARVMLDNIKESCKQEGTEFPFSDQFALIEEHLLIANGDKNCISNSDNMDEEWEDSDSEK